MNTRASDQPQERGAEKSVRSTTLTWRGKIVLLSVSIVSSCFLGELAIRILKPGFLGYGIPQVQHRPTEDYGFEIIPDQKAYTLGQPATINSLGFRGKEIHHDRISASLRVLCLGDSFTFGFGVSDDDTYPCKLERMLDEKWPARDPDVINAGAQGYATYHEIDLLKSRGVGLNPDVVVLAVYLNDLKSRPAGDYSQPYREEYQREANSFRRRFPRLFQVTQNSALIAQLRRSSTKGKYDPSLTAILNGDTTDEVEALWESMSGELQVFKELSDQHDFTPLIVAIPARLQLGKQFPNSTYPRRVDSACDKAQLNTIELTSRLEASLSSGIDPYLDWDHHLNATGNRIVAESIFEWLSNRPSDQ